MTEIRRMLSLPAGTFGVALLLVLAACTPLAGSDPTPGSAFNRESQRVRAVVEGLIEAGNRGNLEGVVASYAQNAVLTPPAGPAIEGRESVRSHYRGVFERDQCSLRVQILETSVMRAAASVRGRTTGRRTPRAGGDSTAIDDQFMAELVLETDGRWRIARLTWSPSSATPH